MLDSKLIETLFARSLFATLREDEGVVVHYEGQGYVVCKSRSFEDDGDNEVRVRVYQNDDMLQYPDLSLIWLEDEPVGNA